MTLNAACKRAAEQCGHSVVTSHQNRLTRYQTSTKSKKPKYEFAVDDESIVKPKQYWLFYDPNNDVRLCKILQIFHIYSSGTTPMRFDSVNDESGFLLIQVLEPNTIESTSPNETIAEQKFDLFDNVSDNNIPSNFTMQLEPENDGDSAMIEIHNIPSDD
eukprot:137293_1